MTQEHVHGGDVFGAAKRLGISESDLLDFSANINPLGPPRGLIDSIYNNINMIVNYPDPHCRDLKNELSEYLGINPGYILPGNGAAELIYLLGRVLGTSRAVIPVPTFAEYGIAVSAAGGRIVEIPLQREECFNLRIEELTSRLKKEDVIFICNPNNPTGNLHSPELLRNILKKAEAKGAYLVIDEAFMEFVDDFEKYSFIKRVENNPNLFIFYSFTKFFSIPGLRLGALLGNPAILEKIKVLKDPWSVNIFAQAGGIAALRESEYIYNTRQLIKNEREYLYSELQNLPGVFPYPGEANYLFVDISGTGYISPDLVELTAREGVLVRDCSNFSGLGENYIRLAVKDRKANDRLLDILAKVLEGESK